MPKLRPEKDKTLNENFAHSRNNARAESYFQSRTKLQNLFDKFLSKRDNSNFLDLSIFVETYDALYVFDLPRTSL